MKETLTQPDLPMGRVTPTHVKVHHEKQGNRCHRRLLAKDKWFLTIGIHISCGHTANIQQLSSLHITVTPSLLTSKYTQPYWLVPPNLL